MSKIRLATRGGVPEPPPPDGPEWPLAEEARALFERAASYRPQAITIVLEGAQVGDGQMWAAISAPGLDSVTIGHVVALADLKLELMPGAE